MIWKNWMIYPIWSCLIYLVFSKLFMLNTFGSWMNVRKIVFTKWIVKSRIVYWCQKPHKVKIMSYLFLILSEDEKICYFENKLMYKENVFFIKHNFDNGSLVRSPYRHKTNFKRRFSGFIGQKIALLKIVTFLGFRSHFEGHYFESWL